jgi:anti-sigma factor RsiW
VRRSLASEPELKHPYEMWLKTRASFNAKLGRRDPDAVREAWQRFYFRGEAPAEGPGAADHINKRRLRTPKLGR